MLPLEYDILNKNKDTINGVFIFICMHGTFSERAINLQTDTQW